MKKELKAAWVTALRSGEYAQGQDVMAYKGEFCCLGVLAEVADVPSEACRGGAREYAFALEAGTRIYCPPPGWQGLTDVAVLIYMNDEGESFDAIADWIESNIQETE